MGTRFVLGLGGTVDYEIRWDSRVLAELATEHGIDVEDLDRDRPVDSVRDLVASVLAFVRDGVGGERFVASSDIVAAVAERFETRVTLGGTCVRAAIAMDRVGVPSTVHLVSVDDNVRRLLPASVGVLNSADHDTLDPHLIVQYPAGARVRVGGVELVAEHPNRIIYANDPPHRELCLAPELPDVLRSTDLFLISSLNVIQERATLDDRLATLRADVAALPADALVMFEDAGYHVPDFATVVRDAMARLVHVYSLNEDELQAYLGRTVDLLDPDDVATAVAELHRLVPVPVLVVHTKYWAMAVGERAEEFRACLHGGIAMAATRYRLGDEYTAHDYAETSDLPVNGRGAVLAEQVEQRLDHAVCVAALDLSAVAEPTTIGLGDTFVGGFLAELGLR